MLRNVAKTAVKNSSCSSPTAKFSDGKKEEKASSSYSHAESGELDSCPQCQLLEDQNRPEEGWILQILYSGSLLKYGGPEGCPTAAGSAQSPRLYHIGGVL